MNRNIFATQDILGEFCRRREAMTAGHIVIVDDFIQDFLDLIFPTINCVMKGHITRNTAHFQFHRKNFLKSVDTSTAFFSAVML